MSQDPFFQDDPPRMNMNASGSGLVAGGWSNTLASSTWLFRGNDQFGFFFFRVQAAATVVNWTSFSLELPPAVPTPIFPSGGGYYGGGAGSYGGATGNLAQSGTVNVSAIGRTLWVLARASNANAHIRGGIYLLFS
jgi:hypothetical protein